MHHWKNSIPETKSRDPVASAAGSGMGTCSTRLGKERPYNKKWADAVIPDFISPFTSKSGKLNSIAKDGWQNITYKPTFKILSTKTDAERFSD